MWWGGQGSIRRSNAPPWKRQGIYLLGGMDERLSAHRLKALPAKVVMHTRRQLLMPSFALDKHQDAALVALGAHHGVMFLTMPNWPCLGFL